MGFVGAERSCYSRPRKGGMGREAGWMWCDWIRLGGMGFQLWLVARRPSTMAQCSAARSLAFNDGAVIRYSLVGFDQ